MPRNGSGTYTLPAGNPVVTGTTISSTTHNNTNNDIAAALTQSISADGQTPWTGPTELFNGSTAETQTLGSKNKLIANTEFVQREILSQPGYRNRVTNGDMGVAQRQASTVAIIPNTLQYGGADRTAVYITASGSITSGNITQQSSNGVSSGKMQSAGNVSGTGISQCVFFYRIESADVFDMSGKTITVSAKLYHNTGLAVNGTVNIFSANALDNFGSVTLVASSGLYNIPNTTLTEVVFTANLPANAAENGLEIRIALQHNSSTISSKNYQIGDLQVELGAITQPVFETLPRSIQIARCMRYCRVISTAGNNVMANGRAISTTGALVYIDLPRMRTAPTVSFPTAVSSFMFTTGSGSPVTATSIALNSSNPDGLAVLITTAGGLTPGDGGTLGANSTSATMFITAEL